MGDKGRQDDKKRHRAVHCASGDFVCREGHKSINSAGYLLALSHMAGRRANNWSNAREQLFGAIRARTRSFQLHNHLKTFSFWRDTEFR